MRPLPRHRIRFPTVDVRPAIASCRLAVADPTSYVPIMSSTGRPMAAKPGIARTLLVGDVLALFVFGVVGRMTHGLPASDASGLLDSTLPFVVGWLVATPWFGLFRAEVATSPARVVSRSLLAWVPVGFPISILLWALVRRRSIPDGIVPEFVVAALAATVVLLVGWRLVYALFHRRERP